MPIESVTKFWQKAQQDAALLAKLAAIPADDQQTALAALVKVAAEAGFTFTVKEYDAAIKEELTRRYGAAELSEQQLEAVAGGRPFFLMTVGCMPVAGPVPGTQTVGCASMAIGGCLPPK